MTDEYAAFCIETIEAVRSSCPDPLIMVEHRLDYSEYVPEGYGTGDMVIVADGIIDVIDLKGGRGVRVEAQRNSQLMLYALGALLEFDPLYDIHTIRMTIVQPRLNNISTYYNQFIQRHIGWEFAGVYADEGITGTKDERPRFQQMLADCRAGKINMIVTKSISRFARNTLTILETVRELKAIGVDVYFEEPNIHSMSGDGELMLTILASFAQEESKSVSDNCKWRIRKDFSEGKPINLMLLYGYKTMDGKIEINDDEAKIVRRIFREYLDGMGSVQIAKRLANEKVPKRFGGEWSSAYVVDVLTNEKYTGDCLLQKTFVEDHLSKKTHRNIGQLPRYYAENTHPAIVDHETYERAQRILAVRREYINIRKPTVARYPFSGKIVCGNCGAKYMRRTRSTGRNSNPRYTWQCLTYTRKL